MAGGEKNKDREKLLGFSSCFTILYSQACVMGHVLSSFCDVLEQQINHGKSTVWFSPRTPSNLWNTICLHFKISTKNDLGIYLRVLLMHSLVRKSNL